MTIYESCWLAETRGTVITPRNRRGSLQQAAGGSSSRARGRSSPRYLPPPPAVVFDIGGGPGVYACWLARLGYAVHLIDPVPLHVEQARQASAQQPDTPIARCTVGDARRLDQADASVDVALLLGPLYHLTERDDRVAALREAARIVRPGGVVLAVGISRFVSTLDGMAHGYLADPAFAHIVRDDLATGQHRNPTNHPAYFTTAYFHHPAELKGEMEDGRARPRADDRHRGAGVVGWSSWGAMG